ncbi:MAG: hypothetical protein ACR2HR_06825 [Euzebya sp.]
MTQYRLPLVLFLGAAILAGLRLAGVTFNITPLFVGLVALAAAAVAAEPKPWTSGIVITAWGIGVLLVLEGPLPQRSAPIYMVAIGIGILVASFVVAKQEQQAVARGSAAAMIAGGVLFYLAFDVEFLVDWWVFSGGLAVAAVVELARAVRSPAPA